MRFRTKDADLARRCPEAMAKSEPITVFIPGSDGPMAVSGCIQAVAVETSTNEFDITILEE